MIRLKPIRHVENILIYQVTGMFLNEALSTFKVCSMYSEVIVYGYLYRCEFILKSCYRNFTFFLSSNSKTVLWKHYSLKRNEPIKFLIAAVVIPWKAVNFTPLVF